MEGERGREGVRNQQLGPAVIHAPGDERAMRSGLGRHSTVGLTLNPPLNHYAEASPGDEGDG